MKVSVNWAKQFTDIDLPLPKLVEKIGAQLGAVEEVVDIGKRYDGVVVVRVVTCGNHPNGDKLTVCLIDDGGVVKKVPRDTNGFIQIVCGAPNVEPGMLAAWLPSGIVVPSTLGSEPLVLEARDIRGVLSHGMLASPKELGFSDDHAGLLNIDEDISPGTAFAKAYKLDDYVIDIENKMFTHRPDLFGMLGIAREIAGISGNSFKSPDWYLKPNLPAVGSEKLDLSVKNEVPKLVPRFCAVAVDGVKVGPSPIWLQSYLMRVGIRPINNIVDLTNFVMYETGQPLHAYDWDRLSSKGTVALSVRLAKSGEELTLLDGKPVALDKDTVVIATGDRVVGIGGVMGGLETAVDGDTKNIVLECASFDVGATRRSARTYGLFTDAAIRFTKNPSPLQNPAVIAKATQDILRIAGGSVASPLQDSHGSILRPATISVGTKFVNNRLGLQLSASQMTKLLNNVEVETQASETKLSVSSPFWRTDLHSPEDIVEEVGRLYGYDHLELKLPMRDLKAAAENEYLAFKDGLRDSLSGAGGNEVLTYSFVHGSLLDRAGQDKSRAFHIRNALSPDLQYYRLSLTPSLLEKIHPNIKSGTDSAVLYELGSVHVRGVNDSERLPAQLSRVGLVVAQRTPVGGQGAPYFTARRYSDYLLDQMGAPRPSYDLFHHRTIVPPEWKPALQAFEPSRAAIVRIGKDLVGIIGEPNRNLAKALKLPAFTAALEFDSQLLAKKSGTRGGYESLNRFPSLTYDLCLRTPKDTTYRQLEKFLDDALGRAGEQHGYGFSTTPLDIYQPENATTHKQTTWRIELWHSARTLTTKEVNDLVDNIAKSARSRLKAIRI